MITYEIIEVDIPDKYDKSGCHNRYIIYRQDEEECGNGCALVKDRVPICVEQEKYVAEMLIKAMMEEQL